MLGSQGLEYVQRFTADNPKSRWYGKTIEVGQRVNWARVVPDPNDGEHADYFAEQKVAEQRNRPGPFRVKQIGIWPCGRVMLYVDSETDPQIRGSGFYLSDMDGVEEGATS